MSSSLFPQIPMNPQAIGNLKNMINMVKGNPQAIIQNMAVQNPQIQSILNMINQSGKSPKELFMSTAKEKGIDPNDLISQLGLK